ncbi:MAG TPA: hypothetical protein VFA11_02900 [Acidimicrobiales bacterium]|nr:hypothetical protein [Acidimicrobiales bacterium]
MTDDAPFDAPWQLRGFALARSLVERGVLRWADVRVPLAAELQAHPERPYWESFVAALESAVGRLGFR